MGVMELRTSRSQEPAPPQVGLSEAGELSGRLDAIVAGQLSAWQAFQAELAPRLERWARAHRAFRRRKLSDSTDDARDVMVATLARLSADDFQNLRRFRAAHPACTQRDLDVWLYGTFDYALRQHLRVRFGRSSRRAGARHEHEGPSKRDLHTLAQRLDYEPVHELASGASSRICAREVNAFVAQRFSTREAEVLRSYLADEGCFSALASEYALGDQHDARRYVRKLKERLRAHFKRSA